MALQTVESLDTGVVANEAYSVIMLAQINRMLNRIEAEVHVYYDMAARLAGYKPLDRFLYVIEDDAKPSQDTTLWLRLVGLGDINITHNETTIASFTVTEETTLEDIAEGLLQQVTSFDVQVSGEFIIVRAIGDLEGSAGVGIDIQGEAIEVVNWLVGSDAVESILDTQFSIDELSEQGKNLQQQIYEHMKVHDARYVDAIDV